MCEFYQVGKASRKPFGKVPRSSYPLELVPMDICEPMSMKTRDDASYFLTLIDDYLCCSYVISISSL